MTEITDKKIIMCISGMRGGGAERIACVLMNEFKKRGAYPSVFLTNQTAGESDRRNLDESIPVTGYGDSSDAVGNIKRFGYKLLRIFSSAVCKVFENLKREVPAYFAYLSFFSQYYGQIVKLRNILKSNPDMTVIAFLQPSIPIALLSARGLKNRVIFSERGDPVRLMKKRFGRKFIEKYYSRADCAVFQTEDAKNTYPENIAEKGVVIFNPISPELPEPYDGVRSKNITTFCRISRQKNLPLLIDAFKNVHKDYPDYKLRIIGSPQNADDESVFEDIKKQISDLSLEESVIFEPFSKDVHSLIIKDAVYVNSSDYEGMSNAMLEAMAIGLPCVCTDCPIGGANAVIKDGENGLLVKLGSADELSKSIKKVISDKSLADTLSANGRKIRDELSVGRITDMWLSLI